MEASQIKMKGKSLQLYSVANNTPPCDCNVEGCNQADGATDRAV